VRYPVDADWLIDAFLVRAELSRRGQLAPDLDLLIAATAMHYDLTLLTRNVRHFARIPGLGLN
jgi:tRNA(fMet)-specific endonuclease VapC